MKFISLGARFWPRQSGILAITLSLILACAYVSASTPATDADPIKKLIKQASKLTRAGTFPEAEALLRQAVAADTTRSDARIELAYVLAKQRSLLEAYELSFAVARNEPANARAFSVLGATLLAAGRFPEARLMFLTAIKLNRKEHLAWAGFGMLDFYENKIERSLENLREAAYYAPSEPDYVFALAQVAARSERYKEAADNYQAFLNISSITDKDRRERIKGLISFLNYLGNSSAIYRSYGRDQTTVPFDLIGNRPVIGVSINGRPEPLRFVLDTGSGISVISDDAARKLGLRPVAKGGQAKGIGGDGKFDIFYGFVREMGIGEVSVKNVPVYIRKFHNENHFDGYIGLALISKFLTTIDYGNQSFSLIKKTDSAPVQNAEMSLPLRLTSSGFLSGEVQLEGIDSPLNFIVDTGASVSVISSAVSKTSGISPFTNNERLRVIGSAGITDDVPTFLLPRVTFGKNSRKDIVAVALDLGIINEASGFEQSGILGGNFLKNYRLTFDFKNSIVTFVSIKPENE
jgi:tetratricopeptide (TPR) repeat protein